MVDAPRMQGIDVPVLRHGARADRRRKWSSAAEVVGRYRGYPWAVRWHSVLLGALAVLCNCGPSLAWDGSSNALLSPHPQRLQPRVLVGLDRLIASRFALLRSKRVAVVTNHTALSADGRNIVDVLHEAKEVNLVAIFTPEHGFRGQAEGAVEDMRDPRTGLPVYSLYGRRRKPTAAQLEGVDTLVFDIQDIGCRFYTYISTLGLCMEAAEQFGKEIVVLDRPNPINGVAVEGPVLDEGLESFVGFHTIPIRHGMTVGEIANLYRLERYPQVRLHVVRMQGWQRGMYYNATERFWVNPSPNMRSLRQALLYPGIGLLETTNLSVGRGTDTPFERFGAPWLDAHRLLRQLDGENLAGVVFVPVKFTPTSSKYAGSECEGLEVIVTDRSTFEPVRTGLAIARALRLTHREQWDMDRYGRLLADRKLLGLLRRGASLDAMMEHCREECEEFRMRRRRALLY